MTAIHLKCQIFAYNIILVDRGTKLPNTQEQFLANTKNKKKKRGITCAN